MTLTAHPPRTWGHVLGKKATSVVYLVMLKFLRQTQNIMQATAPSGRNPLKVQVLKRRSDSLWFKLCVLEASDNIGSSVAPPERSKAKTKFWKDTARTIRRGMPHDSWQQRKWIWVDPVCQICTIHQMSLFNWFHHFTFWDPAKPIAFRRFPGVRKHCEPRRPENSNYDLQGTILSKPEELCLKLESATEMKIGLPRRAPTYICSFRFLRTVLMQCFVSFVHIPLPSLHGLQSGGDRPS